MSDHIDMHGVLETVPTDGSAPVFVSPDRRYWPHSVSGDYLATIAGPDGHEEEHWYDQDGQPADPGSPAIRNRAPALQKDRLFAAFLAGCVAGRSDSGFSEEELFERWYEANKATLKAIGA
jgi:hypothetical protein